MEKKIATAMMGLVVVVLILSPSSALITCQEAVTRMSPCLSYLVGSSKITAACCAAAQALNNAVATKPDRQGVCACFKNVWNGLHVKTEKAKQLPELCGIKLNVVVTPDTDCTKV